MDAAFSLIIQSVFEIFSRSNHQKAANHASEVERSAQMETDVQSLANLTINNKMADFNATKYIKQWQRFKYLLRILKANLQEIVDMWSESKGPLALYFESDEVRHLIRALFMITDKRSAALSKIK